MRPEDGPQEKVWPAEHSHTSPPSWPPGPRSPGTRLHSRLWACDRSTRYCRPLGGKGSGPEVVKATVRASWQASYSHAGTTPSLGKAVPYLSLSSFRGQNPPRSLDILLSSTACSHQTTLGSPTPHLSPSRSGSPLIQSPPEGVPCCPSALPGSWPRTSSYSLPTCTEHTA